MQHFCRYNGTQCVFSIVYVESVIWVVKCWFRIRSMLIRHNGQIIFVLSPFLNQNVTSIFWNPQKKQIFNSMCIQSSQFAWLIKINLFVFYHFHFLCSSHWRLTYSVTFYNALLAFFKSKVLPDFLSLIWLYFSTQTLLLFILSSILFPSGTIYFRPLDFVLYSESCKNATILSIIYVVKWWCRMWSMPIIFSD